MRNLLIPQIQRKFWSSFPTSFPFFADEDLGWDSDELAYGLTCDMHESNTHYLLSFDMPGMKKEEIKVELRGNVLTVTGKRSEEIEAKGEEVYRSERKYGEFYRNITLPSEVTADAVEAEYMDGVLRVAVPKVKSANIKRVPIAEAKSGGLLAKLFSDRKPKEIAAKTEKRAHS